MIVINNKERFSGTLEELMLNYRVSDECLCRLNIEEISECREYLYEDLEEIDFTD